MAYKIPWLPHGGPQRLPLETIKGAIFDPLLLLKFVDKYNQRLNAKIRIKISQIDREIKFFKKQAGTELGQAQLKLEWALLQLTFVALN